MSNKSIVIIDDQKCDLDAVLMLMDKEILDEIVSGRKILNDQEIVDEYMARHAEKYNEEFVFN